MEKDQATQFMFNLLGHLVERQGSDLFISADFPPAIKVDGKITPIADKTLSAAQTIELARAIMNDKQAAMFEQTKECNFAITPGSLGRFRVSAFMQIGRVGMVLRKINTDIPAMDDLMLPDVLKNVAMETRGLVLMVGATGSGKSTTLASMLGYRNQNSHGHIITVEDPVEYVHPNLNCLVTHREIGVDTENWGVALKNALRQAPDVIQIGEIRDRETMDYAIMFAETGHLCLATLHANNANQALDRIVNFFPEERRQQLLMDLSFNLKGMIAQRLIPIKGSEGRRAAVEIMLNSPYIADLIFRNQIQDIKEAMKRSRELGMQTFDQALFDLYEEGAISYEDALRNADSVNDLRLSIKLESKDANTNDLTSGTAHMGLI